MRINYWQEENYPVHLAVKLNDSAILRLLLAAGADPNRPVYGSYPGQLQAINMDGWTPLIIAIEDDRQEMVELLLSHKANPDLSFEGQPKPLFRALSHPEIAELLLQHGADVKVTLADGSTPLHKAVESGQKKLVQALLQRKAEVNAKDQNGLTPLHLAVGKNDPELVEMLLAAGADASGGTPQGDTALHFAVGHQNPKNVELLLAAKADVNARNSQRQTPLGMISPVAPNAPAAVVEIAALLRRHGGLDDLPRDDQIEIRRSSANYSNVVFVKGTNDLNRFTLLEALAVQYGLIAQAQPSGPRAHGTLQIPIPYSSSGSVWPLGFPDFQKLKVLYPRPAGFLESTADVRFPDCSRNPTLPWGTVIEVPEADHPLNATWQGLPSDFVTKLQECLQREVTLTVKGQTTNLVLRPRTNGPPSNFYLRPVLMDSGLIRTSSDLSRVKVKRQDGTAGGVYELTFDCSESAPSPQFPGNVSRPPSPQLPGNASPFPDLWLRDGDVIEVPEKP